MGLFDIAKILVTIDTATTHLSRASKIPTIELTRAPGEWDNTPKGPRCRLLAAYNDIVDKLEPILQMIEEEVFQATRKTFHLVNTHVSNSGNDHHRSEFAKRTWGKLYNKGWIPCHIPDHELKRSSKDIGDTRQMPYIRDLIDRACFFAEPQDVIVITNNDTCIVNSALDDLKAPINRWGCAYCYRYDFHRIDRELTKEEALKGTWYCGNDLFAFTKAWWLKWESKYPDMLLGCEAWDYIMRQMMIMSVGSEACSLNGLIYHQKHDSYSWERANHRLSRILVKFGLASWPINGV